MAPGSVEMKKDSREIYKVRAADGACLGEKKIARGMIKSANGFAILFGRGFDRFAFLSIFFLLSVFIATSSCHAADLSFNRARDLLRERNNSLKAAEANIESKKMASDSLKWLHGPTVSVGAVELWGEAKIDVDRSIKTPLGKMPVDINETYNFSGPRAAVTGTVPIFTGGKIDATQKTAKYAVNEAEAMRDSRINILEAELVAKYFGLQLALSLRKLREDTLKEEESQLARAKKFEQEGMISHVELMGVKVARDAAERESLKARNNARAAKVELGRLLLSENLGTLTTPLFVLRDPLPPMETWVNRALKSNPQMAVMEARVKQGDQGVEASRSSWFPQAVGFGQYLFAKPHQSYLKPEWMAGIGVNLTLWDSRDRLASFKSAKAIVREARATQLEVANQIRKDAETAWIGAQNAREQYNLTASNVAYARENLDLKLEGFGEGLYTALDVTQARDQLLAAEVERRVAAFEFVVNYAMLHVISGTMSDFMRAYSKKDVILEK